MNDVETQQQEKVLNQPSGTSQSPAVEDHELSPLEKLAEAEKRLDEREKRIDEKINKLNLIEERIANDRISGKGKLMKQVSPQQAEVEKMVKEIVGAFHSEAK